MIYLWEKLPRIYFITHRQVILYSAMYWEIYLNVFSALKNDKQIVYVVQQYYKTLAILFLWSFISHSVSYSYINSDFHFHFSIMATGSDGEVFAGQNGRSRCAQKFQELEAAFRHIGFSEEVRVSHVSISGYRSCFDAYMRLYALLPLNFFFMTQYCIYMNSKHVK